MAKKNKIKYGKVYWKDAQYRKNMYSGRKCVGYVVCDLGGRIIGQKVFKNMK